MHFLIAEYKTDNFEVAIAFDQTDSLDCNTHKHIRHKLDNTLRNPVSGVWAFNDENVVFNIIHCKETLPDSELQRQSNHYLSAQERYKRLCKHAKDYKSEIYKGTVMQICTRQMTLVVPELEWCNRGVPKLLTDLSVSDRKAVVYDWDISNCPKTFNNGYFCGRKISDAFRPDWTLNTMKQYSQEQYSCVMSVLAVRRKKFR